MARKRSADYDNIQETIIDRAAEIFARRGYAATSIGDIATACGCSKARLYHYFDSKEAILREMLDAHVEGLLSSGRRSIDAIADPAERFRRLVRTFLEAGAASRDRHIVLLTCLDALPDENRGDLVAKQRELIAYVRDILLQLRPDLADDTVIARLDTMLFFGMINWTYTWYRAEGPVSPDRLTERAVELFVNGYANVGRR